MKATFFTTLAAMASSAFAAPLLSGLPTDKALNIVNGAKDTVTTTTSNVVTLPEVPVVNSIVKREPIDVGGLITLLTGLVDKVKDQTGAIEVIVSQVKSGELTKVAGADAAVPQFKAIHATITEVVTKLTGVVGLSVPDLDVDSILSLVVSLVTVTVTSVKNIVAVTGLRPQLLSVLHNVFAILNSLLALVTGLVAAIIPGLISTIGPILEDVPSVLASVLSPVVGLVSGLKVSISLA
ncbi:hypothetical protein AK830_g11726 [Neonectria ditissima]|uniref:Uncharacterized protein n=1 Tax=Neonectria ditissima TaxID=78410 RepID=A0A0P7ACA0_9HYPO|nr:hypothetical protein AK830_g11726 [Neonectria ditissima]